MSSVGVSAMTSKISCQGDISAGSFAKSRATRAADAPIARIYLSGANPRRVQRALAALLTVSMWPAARGEGWRTLAQKPSDRSIDLVA